MSASANPVVSSANARAFSIVDKPSSSATITPIRRCYAPFAAAQSNALAVWSAVRVTLVAKPIAFSSS